MPWSGSGGSLSDRMWAQGGTGRGDEGDGEFDLSLKMVLEMSLLFLEDNTMQLKEYCLQRW